MGNPALSFAGRLVAILVGLALLVGAGYWWGHSDSESKWKLAWSERDGRDRESQRAFTEQQRRIELQRQGELDEIQRQYATKLAAADANLNAARVQSKRLQSGIDVALAQLRAGGRDTDSSAQRQAKDQTGYLLAELYREINDRSVALAGEADDAWLRGKQCEASYDALTLKKAAR
jgi:hypothetical protein